VKDSKVCKLPYFFRNGDATIFGSIVWGSGASAFLQLGDVNPFWVRRIRKLPNVCKAVRGFGAGQFQLRGIAYPRRPLKGPVIESEAFHFVCIYLPLDVLIIRVAHGSPGIVAISPTKIKANRMQTITMLDFPF
jgi:hypothetical protein